MPTLWKSDMRKKRKREAPVLNYKESDLQKQCNDYLDINQLFYVRIDDGVWKSLNYVLGELKAKGQIKLAGILKNAIQQLKNRFAGLPDVNISEGVNDKYTLGLHLELKSTKGKKHGKQKNVARRIPVQESRTPEQTMGAVCDYLEMVDIIKEVLKRIEENEPRTDR